MRATSRQHTCAASSRQHNRDNSASHVFPLHLGLELLASSAGNRGPCSCPNKQAEDVSDLLVSILSQVGSFLSATVAQFHLFNLFFFIPFGLFGGSTARAIMDKSGVFGAVPAYDGSESGLDTPVGLKAGTVEDIQNMERLGKEQLFKVRAQEVFQHSSITAHVCPSLTLLCSAQFLLRLHHGLFPHPDGNLGNPPRHSRHQPWQRWPLRPHLYLYCRHAWLHPHLRFPLALQAFSVL